MPYHVSFNRRSNFIHAIVTGTNTAETVLQYMNDIRQECERQDCYRVLIEEKLEGPRLDEMEIFSLINQGSQNALGFFDALAYIDEQQDYDLVKFAETVAVNRGIPIATFTSLPDAENWLRHRGDGADEQQIFTSDSGD